MAKSWSLIAIASFILGVIQILIGIACFILNIFPLNIFPEFLPITSLITIFAILLGIIGYGQISKNPKLKGKLFAILGIILTVLYWVIIIALFDRLESGQLP